MTYAAFDRGSWRCYRIVNGLYRLFLGCTYTTPRAAIAHTSDTYVSPLRRETIDQRAKRMQHERQARYLRGEQAHVSPLRREAHADPGPLLGSGQSGFSPEPRSCGSRLVGQAGE